MEKLENRVVEEKNQIGISEFKPIEDNFRRGFLKLSKEERFKNIDKIKEHLELLVTVKYPTNRQDIEWVPKVINFWTNYYREYSDKKLIVNYFCPAINKVMKEKMKGVEV